MKLFLGDLKYIKSQYSKSKLNISGEFDKKKLENVEGIEDIKELRKNEYIIKIGNDSIINKILNKLKDDKIYKFSLMDVSLNDIFIERVGKTYEE